MVTSATLPRSSGPTATPGFERARIPLLVLDTSVAVKWYLTEELDDQATRLLEAAESGTVEFLAPSAVQPEFFNALRQRRRRGELSLEEMRREWADFASDYPTTLYAPEDLIPRAAEIALETGVIVYDALFLALAEDSGTIMVTADTKLLNYSGRYALCPPRAPSRRCW